MSRKKSSAVEKIEPFEDIKPFEDEAEKPFFSAKERKQHSAPPPSRGMTPQAPFPPGMRNKKIEGEELLNDSIEKKVLDLIVPYWNAFSRHDVDENVFIDELRKFLSGNLSRHAERNRPPVPKRKFVPRKDQIIPFLDEVWGEWIAEACLTKPLLKEHDAKAYDALMNYQRNRPLPPGLELATQKEANDLFLMRHYFTADEVHRVVGLLSRRKDGNSNR